MAAVMPWHHNYPCLPGSLIAPIGRCNTALRGISGHCRWASDNGRVETIWKTHARSPISCELQLATPLAFPLRNELKSKREKILCCSFSLSQLFRWCARQINLAFATVGIDGVEGISWKEMVRSLVPRDFSFHPEATFDVNDAASIFSRDYRK